MVVGDGAGDSLTVITNEAGAFFVSVPVSLNEQGGDRTVVVQSPGGVTAIASVKVIEDTTPMVGMPGFGLG